MGRSLGRGYSRGLDRAGIESGLERAKHSIEELESIRENYMADKEYYETMFEYLGNLEGIDLDVKREMLTGLRDSIIEFQMSYNENVEEKMQEQKEIIEDLLIEAGEKLKKYDEAGKTINAYEKFTSLGRKELETGTDTAKTKVASEKSEIKKISNDASKDLELKIQQNEMIRRQIMRDTFSGKI